MIDGIECAFPATLTQDAEVKTTSAGRPFLKLSVVTGKDEKQQFVSVLAWRDTFTELAPHLTKGTRVYVEGRLELRHWNGGSGLSVSASLIQPLGLIGAKKPKAPRAGKKAKADPQRPLETSAPAFNDSIDDLF
jgi:single-stranded DNA-binding protein